MLSKWFIIVDLNSDHLTEEVLIRFLNWKLLFLHSIPHCALWKEVTVCNSMELWFMPPHQGWSISINYLKFFCKRDLPLSSHLFIYPVICLYWCRLTPCALKTASSLEDKWWVYCLCLWITAPAHLMVVLHWPYLCHLYISVVFLCGLFCTAHIIPDCCGEQIIWYAMQKYRGKTDTLKMFLVDCRDIGNNLCSCISERIHGIA